jgi:hypothetical protein
MLCDEGTFAKKTLAILLLKFLSFSQNSIIAKKIPVPVKIAVNVDR